jgi:hypothetical protein
MVIFKREAKIVASAEPNEADLSNQVSRGRRKHILR